MALSLRIVGRGGLDTLARVAYSLAYILRTGVTRTHRRDQTPDHIKRTGLAAIECFNDPARRDHYFETLYDDDVVLYGYTRSAVRITLKRRRTRFNPISERRHGWRALPEKVIT